MRGDGPTVTVTLSLRLCTCFPPDLADFEITKRLRRIFIPQLISDYEIKRPKLSVVENCELGAHEAYNDP